MLPVSELPLLVKQRVCCVEILSLPFLASGRNENIISDDMADLQLQGIVYDGNNDPAPKKIP